MSFSNCKLSGFEIIKLVSSANRSGVDKSGVAFGTSFMYSKKKRGPNIDPYGTPSDTSSHSEQ